MTNTLISWSDADTAELERLWRTTTLSCENIGREMKRSKNSIYGRVGTLGLKEVPRGSGKLAPKPPERTASHSDSKYIEKWVDFRARKVKERAMAARRVLEPA